MGCASLNPNSYFLPRQIKWLGKGCLGHTFVYENTVSRILYVKKILKCVEYSVPDLEQILKVLQRYMHPLICRYVYSSLDRVLGEVNVYTEFCTYGNLASRIENAKKENRLFPEEIIVSWLKYICIGLQYLYDNLILHLDLKPENIVFDTKDSTPRICDFGNYQIIYSTQKVATHFKGTLGYKSPEICLDEPYDSSADVWSLGCILYEICTLNKLFEFQSNDEYMNTVCKAEIFIPQIPSEYSFEIIQLIEKMLIRKKEKRITIEGILKSPLLNIDYEEIYKLQKSQEMLTKVENNYGSKILIPSNLRNLNEVRTSEIERQRSLAALRKVQMGSPRADQSNGYYSLNSLPVQEIKISEPLQSILNMITENKETAIPPFYDSFKIGDRYAPIIANAIKSNFMLKELNFKCSEIGNIGAIEIANVLKDHPSIISIDLANNLISDDGGVAFAMALEQNRTIKSLKMEYNNLGDKSAQYFAHMLRINNTLAELALDFNFIGEQGVKFFAEILQFNQGLQTLSLTNNKIPYESMQLLLSSNYTNIDVFV